MIKDIKISQVTLPENNNDKLTKIHFWAYGVGHFINDLVVACWFNFLLYFLKRVAETPVAPYVLLIGQIADGITTPLVGYFSDRCETRYGKRMPWYLFGVILVSISFMPLFIVVRSTYEQQFAYYVSLGVIFSVGWAAVQISHMSLVPSLTLDRQKRDVLNNKRNMFTFASNFIVLGAGLIIFEVVEDNELQFIIISSISLLLGIIASIFFICVIRQRQLTVKSQQQSESKVQSNNHNNWEWFKMPSFYLFGFCYMGVRIYTNIFGTLLPFYLVEVLKLGSDTSSGISFNLALVPLICYFSSVVTAGYLNWLYQNLGRKKTLIFGAAICIWSLFFTYFASQDFAWTIYFLAIFIGCSQAMVLGTGINLISEVVGHRGSKGAFVFGIYSFLDKITVGVIIYLVSNSDSYTKTDSLSIEDIEFIKLTITLIPGLSCLLGVLIVLFYPIPEYTNKNQSSSDLVINQTQ